ncbi:MAG TPA: cytochrome c, partial [Acidobacteriota bacterium]|nr:cytochrome c [Acidobacteriota bacterium]
EETELSEDMTVEEMIATGREIAEGKGLCLTCHTIGQSGALRFPDLEGIGARAATRVPGLSAEEYLRQSLYEPNAYIVSGFAPGMPAVNRPPIGLTDEEILTVIAFLQSMGGEVTVSLSGSTDQAAPTSVQPSAVASESPPPTETAVALPAAVDENGGAALLRQHGCTSCHNLDSPDRLQADSFMDIGARLSYSEILEGILIPQAGHESAEFVGRMTISQAQEMARFLETRRAEP